MSQLTQEKLKKLIEYDPDTGCFYWKKNKGTGKLKGIAGYLNSNNGYIIIMIDGKNYRAHRLAFLFMNGSMPSNQVDHINHIRSDNKWKNLSLATNKSNSLNHGKNINNTSGVTGVYWSANRWRANICVDYKTICLGRFVEFSDAVNARKNAEVLYGFHKNHGKKNTKEIREFR